MRNGIEGYVPAELFEKTQKTPAADARAILVFALRIYKSVPDTVAGRCPLLPQIGFALRVPVDRRSFSALLVIQDEGNCDPGSIRPLRVKRLLTIT